MEEVKALLSELYEKYGHNEITVDVSQFLDKLIIKKQMEEFEKWRSQKA